MPKGFSHHVLHKTLLGFGLWCCLFLLPTAVHSATTNSATLQWGANSESDLAGYKMYQGTMAGSYDTSVDVGNTTIYSAQNLQSGLTYYFALTAYDTSGNESPPSIEVSKTSADTLSPETTSPVPGSTLVGATQTFSWTANDATVTEWWFYVGTSTGGSNIYDSGRINGATSSDTVNGLPTTGSTLYVRLWYKEDSSWNYIDATYTAYTASTDTHPPSITLTSPTTGTTLSDPVTLTASATDNMGVVGVQFQLNGTNLGGEDTTTPFSVFWDTGGAAPGSYTLTAIARDAAGNTTSSDPVQVTLASSSPTLSVSVVGGGSVTSSPTGILCTSGTCSASYGVGSTVTLIAQANKRWNFAGWSGACSGTSECVIQLSTDQFVGATFSKNGKGAGKGGGRKK